MASAAKSVRRQDAERPKIENFRKFSIADEKCWENNGTLFKMIKIVEI